MKHTQGEVKRLNGDSRYEVMIKGEHPNDYKALYAEFWLGLGADHDEREANVERFIALWNVANGMPTAEAVKYIEHGREMVEVLDMAYKLLKAVEVETGHRYGTADIVKSTLTKLEAK